MIISEGGRGRFGLRHCDTYCMMGDAMFFNHWGGEAIQRLAYTASADLERQIRSLGTPAVVAFNIPAFGCCTRSDYRLAPTMLGLMFERAGLIERNYEAWDVLLKRPIPPECIESVLPNDDPTLADFPRGTIAQ